MSIPVSIPRYKPFIFLDATHVHPDAGRPHEMSQLCWCRPEREMAGALLIHKLVN